MFSPQLLFPFSPELRFHFFKGVLGISEIFGKKSSLCMLTKFVYFYSAVCLHHRNVAQLLVTNQTSIDSTTGVPRFMRILCPRQFLQDEFLPKVNQSRNYTLKFPLHGF